MSFRKDGAGRFKLDLNAGESVGIIRMCGQWCVVHPRIINISFRLLSEAKTYAINLAKELN